MRIIIVEDEALAAEHLRDLLIQYDPTINLEGLFDSVEATLKWLNTNPLPDLAFLDIQLADGLSFELFEKFPLRCPVIFTTAYNEYALKAFKVNSIDYLLKPVDLEDLSGALKQYHVLKQAFTTSYPMDAIQNVMNALKPSFKSRFLVKMGHQLGSVQAEDIAYFYHENKVVWLKKHDNKKHAVDYTLDQLEGKVDPARFFRLNRKFLASIDAIKEVRSYSNSRLKITLNSMPDSEEILISREKVGAFKVWLDS